MIIYKIQNKINQKMYIGKTITNEYIRFSQHIKSSEKGSNTLLHKAIKKYGKNNFYVEKIDSSNSLTELNEKEILHIKNFKPEYNMTPGGDGGWFLSEEVKQLRNKQTSLRNQKNKNKSYEDIYGPEKSKEIKEKISIKQKGIPKKLNDEQIIKKRNYMKNNNPMKKGHTSESKRKISNTLKERKVNIGEKNGMKKHPEAKLKIGNKNSKIHYLKNINTGKEILVKNITRWSKLQNKNPSTVLVYFCNNKSINDWIRLCSYPQSSLPSNLEGLEII
jgi:group I intron endonuclease